MQQLGLAGSPSNLRPTPPLRALADTPRQEPLPGGRAIKYVHGLAEATPYADASWDMVTFQFIAHECPQVRARGACSERV